MYKVAVLVLHDFANLSFQVLQEENEGCDHAALDEIAENLNQMFTLSKSDKQFCAKVSIEEREDIAEAMSQSEPLYSAMIDGRTRQDVPLSEVLKLFK